MPYNLPSYETQSAINLNVGSNNDIANAEGSLHAKLKDLKNNPAINGAILEHGGAVEAVMEGSGSRKVILGTGANNGANLSATITGRGKVHLIAGGYQTNNTALSMASILIDGKVAIGVNGGFVPLNIPFNTNLKIYYNSSFSANNIKVIYELY